MTKKHPFEKPADYEYGRDLVALAKEIGRIIKRYNVTDLVSFGPLKEALDKYSELIGPWAKARAERFIQKAERIDKRTWTSATRGMSVEIRRVINETPTGQTVQELINDQVSLIKSLPRDAAERVQRLAIENVEKGGRFKSILDEIARSGEVTASRAKTIARTETSRASATLTQVRAQKIGSEGYIWRTAKDGDVRKSHKKMEGKFVRWDTPPTLDGMTGHAGCLPNCRCFAEPVIPRELFDE